jgi:hypothetical protein
VKDTTRGPHVANTDTLQLAPRCYVYHWVAGMWVVLWFSVAQIRPKYYNVEWMESGYESHFFLLNVCFFSSAWNKSVSFICLHGIAVIGECNLKRLKVWQISKHLQPHYGPGVDWASNINEYQESSWGGGGGKGRPARKADNLTAICEPIVYKTWEPRRLTTL